VSAILRKPSIAVATWVILVLGLFAWRGDLSLGDPDAQETRTTAKQGDGPVVVRRTEVPELPRSKRTGLVYDSMGFLLVGADVVPTDGIAEKTGADGSFSLNLLKFQTSDVLVRAEGRRSIWVRTSAISPDPLVVRLIPSAPWDVASEMPEPALKLRGEGIVRGLDGRPLANAFVNVLGTDCWGRTGETGRVELPLPSPQVTFVLHQPGRVGQVGGVAALSQPFVSPRTHGVVPLPDLMAELGGSIRGIVRNDHGVPVAGLPVEVRGPGGNRRVQTGAGGVFVLGGLMPADYEVEPFAFRGAVAKAISVRVDRAVVACDLHLHAVKEVGLRIVDESGALAVGVWVVCSLHGLRRGVDQAGADGVVNLPISFASEFEVRMGDNFASCEIKHYDAKADPATLVIAQP
jgi:hypothetical protein